MKKLLMILIFSMFFISLTSAIPSYTKDQSFELTAVCDNCTQVNLTKVVYPNGSFALLGELPMTKNGTNYNYSFSSSTMGIFTYSTCGDLDGIKTCDDTIDRTFAITYNGRELSIAQGIMYIVLIVLLVLFVISLLIVRSSLPDGNSRSDDGRILSINKLKYIRPAILVLSYFMVAFICYIASNLAFAYLSESLVASVFFYLFRIMMVASPVIIVVWFITIFFSVFEDKEMKKVMLFQGFNNSKGGFNR